VAVKTVDPQYFNYAIETGGGVTPDAPQVTPITVPLKIMEQVELTIPSGHAGATGFSMRVADTIILPWESGYEWIRGNDDRFIFAVNIQIDGEFQVVTYNEGSYNHTHYIRFRLADLRALPLGAGLAAPLTLVAPVAA